MKYSAQIVANMLDTYTYKVTVLANKNKIGFRKSRKLYFTEEDVEKIRSIICAERFKEIESIKKYIIKYQPIRMTPLDKISNTYRQTLERIIANFTEDDPLLWEDDCGRLRYGFSNYCEKDVDN